MKNFLFLAVLILLCTATLQAQTIHPAAPVRSAVSTPADEGADLVRMTAEDYINLRLPPLHVLLENARERSPQVNMFAANKESEERELKTLRRTWLKYIKLNGTFSYGTNDTNSQMYYDENRPIIQNITGMTQRWWNVGAAVSLPLDEIFDRRNRSKQQKKRIESITYEMDSWYDEICLKIIESYTMAVQNLALLESSSRSMVAAKAQYTAAEADFINGKIDAQTLSRQKSIENSALREYEQTRSLLNKALLQLEVLSKTPIISQTPQPVDKKR